MLLKLSIRQHKTTVFRKSGQFTHKKSFRLCDNVNQYQRIELHNLKQKQHFINSNISGWVWIDNNGMATNLEVIVGTYEQFLLGYKVEQDDDKYSLHQSFAVQAHIASIRTVHAKGKFLSSGGADDRIYVYDMKKRQEVQLITTHNAMVNHVRFTPDASHLFSVSSDGSVAATRTGSWILEGLWKAPHGGKAVNHLSIHPSGKLALTIGADLTLKTWDLARGRQVFTTNLKIKSTLGLTIDFIEFCPTGKNFALSGSRAVEVWNIEIAGIIKTIACKSKPTSLCWLDEGNILIGLNDGKLVWNRLDENDDDEPLTFQMYESRVKGLRYQNEHLASISSNGDVTVWTVDIAEQNVTEYFADEYVLKREDSDTEEISQKVKHETKVKTARKLGKVVIEVDDDDEEINFKQKESKTKIKTPKKPKPSKDKIRADNVDKLCKSGESIASVLPAPAKLKSKKRQSLPSNLHSAKKAKLKRNSMSNLKNNSGFIEEDNE